ncbi:CAP domain-containing protein [Nibricoccus sp. IMCC34717]|uniref:CAP domain-containing protein n=1 Tax=Nibricoccus sp. IMCC34717 TaxID=3034021 RepID=UPI00384C41CB
MNFCRHRLLNLWALLLCWAFSMHFLSAADPGPYPRDDKDAAREWFWKWWPKGHELTTGFTGSYENGIAGETSTAWKEAMETRVNLFRRVVGLSPLVRDPAYDALCQKGAIILAGSWQTHSPAKTEKNWTQEGYNACKASLLTSGETWRNPVMDLIYDGGTPLGHRSSILTPGLRRTGFGAANTAQNAAEWRKPYSFLMYNNDPSAEVVDPAFTDPFVLWPAKGWIPTRLIPANWSIECSDTWNNPDFTTVLDLKGCTIEAWRNGVKMPIGGTPSLSGGNIVISMDGTVVNQKPYKDGGSGKVVDGVQTPVVEFMGNEMLFCHDVMHGEISAFGLNRDTEDPFGDVIYDVKISGIKVRATGALWNGTGIYEYQVKGFDLQTPGKISGKASLRSISTRSPVLTGSGVQIGGFVIDGAHSRKVLVRGSAPSLAQFGVKNLLPDPKLTVYRLDRDKKTIVGTNDNWDETADHAAEIEKVSAAVGAYPWPRGSKEAALVLTLVPGNYTGVVEGAKGETGNGLVEVYDADEGDTGSHVANISSRTYVSDDPSGYQIAGFILKGDKPRTVLIRVSGQDLEQFGVKDVLNYCEFTLYAGDTRIGPFPFQWWDFQAFVDVPVPYRETMIPRFAKASAAVGAFPLKEGKGAAVALLTLLPDVPYTVVVKAGFGYPVGYTPPYENTKGNALVEVYEFP